MSSRAAQSAAAAGIRSGALRRAGYENHNSKDDAEGKFPPDDARGRRRGEEEARPRRRNEAPPAKNLWFCCYACRDNTGEHDSWCLRRKLGEPSPRSALPEESWRSNCSANKDVQSPSIRLKAASRQNRRCLMSKSRPQQPPQQRRVRVCRCRPKAWSPRSAPRSGSLSPRKMSRSRTRGANAAYTDAKVYELQSHTVLVYKFAPEEAGGKRPRRGSTLTAEEEARLRRRNEGRARCESRSGCRKQLPRRAEDVQHPRPRSKSRPRQPPQSPRGRRERPRLGIRIRSAPRTRSESPCPTLAERRSRKRPREEAAEVPEETDKNRSARWRCNRGIKGPDGPEIRKHSTGIKESGREHGTRAVNQKDLFRKRSRTVIRWNRSKKKETAAAAAAVATPVAGAAAPAGHLLRDLHPPTRVAAKTNLRIRVEKCQQHLQRLKIQLKKQGPVDADEIRHNFVVRAALGFFPYIRATNPRYPQC